MKQKDSPVELPDHTAVGTSRKGERTPPMRFPNGSRTGFPFSTFTGSACGAGVPFSTHSVRSRQIALKPTELGNRLRGPSLQLIGGTVRPALTISAGAAAKLSSFGVA